MIVMTHAPPILPMYKCYILPVPRAKGGVSLFPVLPKWRLFMLCFLNVWALHASYMYKQKWLLLNSSK